MKQNIITNKSPSSPVLSQGISFENLIFVSGQVANDLNGKLIEGTTEVILNQIFRNITEILNAGNSELDNILKATIYMTDISILSEINKLYPKYFSDILPAREAVCVKELPLGANIEISVIAFKNK